MFYKRKKKNMQLGDAFNRMRGSGEVGLNAELSGDVFQSGGKLCHLHTQ
jgi:hypothetical protein